MNGKLIKRDNAGKFNGENVLKIIRELLEIEYDDYKVFILLYSSIENDIVFYCIQCANYQMHDNDLNENVILIVVEKLLNNKNINYELKTNYLYLKGK